MKKLVVRIFIVVIAIAMFISLGVDTSAKTAQTLGELKQELTDLQNKKAAQDKKKKQTESEIAANKNKVLKTSRELEETKADIETVKKEIEETNIRIDDLKTDSESILRLYQQLESENVYISYITGASSMTDLIMRMDAISQLTDYNDEKINEMEQLSNDNKKLNKELDKYEVKLNERIEEYEAAIDALGDELEGIEEGVVDLATQISQKKETIKTYEAMGCKDDELLSVCSNLSDSTGWLKPVSKGRITSLYGYRNAPTAGASSNHKGIDIGVAEGTPAYATASGTVGAIVRKSSCGGNMVYVWVRVNGKPYTFVFMHLLEIKVSVGDAVNVNTVIGLSGGGSTAKKNGGYDRCTTGAHLHYGLAEGGFYDSSNFNSHTINPPGYPGLYQWFYSR